MTSPGICRLFIVCLFCVASVIAAPAQNVFFTTLANFDGTDGTGPQAALVQADDGNFYGTTAIGGNYAGNCQSQGNFGCGTVFKITPAGTLSKLYGFCSRANCSDGAFPLAGLVQASDGNFYGTTSGGGANLCGVYGCGTVYKITSAGALTTLYSFCAQPHCSDGSAPSAGLVQGTDGNFYGTTSGTVFKITPAGALTTLYTFCSSGWPCTDGIYPNALVQGMDGNFYGTTYMGGAYEYCSGPPGDGSCGTVFKITPSGALTTLYSFCGSGPPCTDGNFPYTGQALVQGRDGDFYGTTENGGTNYGTGTVFKITPTGTLTTPYSFCALSNCADGSGPWAGLVQASDGNFYGTTRGGGAYYGTVFEITSTGTLTTLHSFDFSDGAYPVAALVQATNGVFYGTASNAGADEDGTVFRLGVVHTCATCRP